MRAIADLQSAIQSMMPSGGRPIIAICGLAGSGKTTAARALAAPEALDAALVELDWFARYPTLERRERMARARATKDPNILELEENPLNWYDWTAYVAALRELESEGSFEFADAWDQKTGLKGKRVVADASNGRPIVCEGIYLLHDPVFELADVTVLLSVNEAVARARADARDSHRSEPAYLAYKQYLTETYDLPYMAEFGSRASIACDLSNVARGPSK